MPSATGSTDTFHTAGYQMIRVIGTGAHSTIWEARNTKTGQSAAVKRIIKTSSEDEKFFIQAQTEYEVARQIDHPNVRKIYELRRVRKFFFIKELHMVMEYCVGQNVQQHRPETPLEACCIFAQVANAMHKINEAGYVHADMKPNNIIVDPNGNVKIIDMGQSCKIGTVKERIQGTPDFIAPEQVGRLPLEPRTDVFNFGASLYWALTGKAGPNVLPQQGSLQLPGGNHITPPEKHNPAITPLLSRLVLDCLQMAPAHRPATMRDVSTRLGIILKKELTA